ncbi:hypothetical protein [Jiangella sp. DSM 45060]|uniref:hypothetical protein n=1 Tax=Jiangella sp. DSM 45060 TaxID=1798224 RepID=UPI00087ADF6D|nr:hypothetical protein [Jiangella sp. DSM 45060]SDT69389.1 hypothetical protein SAMN04515669_6014 [Jiangella sp. DSM 45060]
MSARGDHAEYVAFARRILRALGRRMAAADPEDLVELLALSRDVDTAIVQAIVGLRAAGFSWSEIAIATGTTRQAAHKRWAADVDRLSTAS